MAEASQHDDLAEILAEASQQQQQDPTNIVARLKRAYVNEKNAPELLPFEHDLLEQVMAKVEDQELVVQQSREAAAAAGGGGGGPRMVTGDLVLDPAGALYEFRGTWEKDMERSTSQDEHLAALGVPWLVRTAIVRSRQTTAIATEGAAWTETTQNIGGRKVQTLQLDNTVQQRRNPLDQSAVTMASALRSDGCVVTESEYVDKGIEQTLTRAVEWSGRRASSTTASSVTKMTLLQLGNRGAVADFGGHDEKFTIVLFDELMSDREEGTLKEAWKCYKLLSAFTKRLAVKPGEGLDTLHIDTLQSSEVPVVVFDIL